MTNETSALTRKQMESLVSSYYKVENLILFFQNSNIDNIISTNPHFFDYQSFKYSSPPDYDFFKELNCILESLEEIVWKD